MEWVSRGAQPAGQIDMKVPSCWRSSLSDCRSGDLNTTADRQNALTFIWGGFDLAREHAFIQEQLLFEPQSLALVARSRI